MNRPAPNETLDVYSGRELRGTIVPRKNRFEARDAAGRKLGSFDAVVAARNAILASAPTPSAAATSLSAPTVA